MRYSDKMPNLTIKDIARISGCSVSTISRVIKMCIRDRGHAAHRGQARHPISGGRGRPFRHHRYPHHSGPQPEMCIRDRFAWPICNAKYVTMIFGGSHEKTMTLNPPCQPHCKVAGWGCSEAVGHPVGDEMCIRDSSCTVQNIKGKFWPNSRFMRKYGAKNISMMTVTLWRLSVGFVKN